jgi:hypothetical protein
VNVVLTPFTLLARICADEPELEGALWVEQVTFELSAN